MPAHQAHPVPRPHEVQEEAPKLQGKPPRNPPLPVAQGALPFGARELQGQRREVQPALQGKVQAGDPVAQGHLLPLPAGGEAKKGRLPSRLPGQEVHLQPRNLQPGPEEGHPHPQDLPPNLREALPREVQPPLPEGQAAPPSLLPGHLALQVPREGQGKPLRPHPPHRPGLPPKGGKGEVHMGPRKRPLRPARKGQRPQAETLQDQAHPLEPHLPGKPLPGQGHPVPLQAQAEGAFPNPALPLPPPRGQANFQAQGKPLSGNLHKARHLPLGLPGRHTQPPGNPPLQVGSVAGQEVLHRRLLQG
jgi:hypothetical protein